MTFFEEELKKIVDNSTIIKNPKFVGDNCMFKVSDDVNGKLYFVTNGYSGHYSGLQVDLINKKEGLVDNLRIYIADVIGVKKGRDGRDLSPYIWSSDMDWYMYHPTDREYFNLADAIDNYLSYYV